MKHVSAKKDIVDIAARKVEIAVKRKKVSDLFGMFNSFCYA